MVSEFFSGCKGEFRNERCGLWGERGNVKRILNKILKNSKKMVNDLEQIIVL